MLSVCTATFASADNFLVVDDGSSSVCDGGVAWDFQVTPTADQDALTAAVVGHLSEPVVPVELTSFSVG